MKKKFLLLTLMLLIVSAYSSFACTNFIVTKGASADGSVMITYSADSHVHYGDLYYSPAAVYPDGAMLDVYEWDTGKYLGKIKQAKKTYNVIGNMNEYQLAIGESTFGGRKELSTQSGAIVDYGSLMYIALQRSKSAREAIRVMAELVAEYGYASEGESFSIADKNEAWIMEMIGKGEGEKGAVWVAIRIPDGYISGHANQARIRQFTLANGKTSITEKDFEKKLYDPKVEVIYSSDVIEFARKKGWFNGKDEEFSFSDTYHPLTFDGARTCEIRVWSMFRQVADGMDEYIDYVSGKNLSNRMPLYVKPNRKISLQDMMFFMRDHLEGTPFDMRFDIGAGPFQLPYRWRPLDWTIDGQRYINERATATQQTAFSFVTQSRSWLPDEIGGIIWFGVDDAASCVYTPIYSASRKVPHSYAQGNGAMMKWSDDAAFWVFNQVANFAYTRYNIIHPDIEQKQDSLETAFINKVKEIDAYALQLHEVSPYQAIDYVSTFSADNADRLVMYWKEFYKFLFLKYMDGNVKYVVPGERNPKVEWPGYGEEWYRRIIQETGDKFKVIE